MILKKAEIQDFDSYYKIKCGKSDIYWNAFETEPNREGLYGAYLTRLEDHPDQTGSKVIYFICGADGTLAGYIQITYFEQETELGYSILQEYQNRGYGTQAVAEVLKLIGKGVVFAQVRQDNVPSRRCFEKNGFTKQSNYSQKYHPLDGKTFSYDRFEIRL